MCPFVAVGGGPGFQQASEHVSFLQPLGSLLNCYCKGSFLTLEEVAWLALDSLGRSGFRGSAALPLSLHGSLADDSHLDSCLDDDGNWDMGALLTSGAWNSRPALRDDFDRL